MLVESFLIKNRIVSFRVAASNAGDIDGESALAHGKRGTIEAEADALPSLHKAFSACRQYYAEIMEIPEPETYAEKVQVYGLVVKRTAEGTRSVQVLVTIQLESRVDYLHKAKTPFMMVDKAAPGESGEVVISTKAANALKKMVSEAEKYCTGERSQQRLDFKDKALQAQVDEGKDDGPKLF